MLFRNWALAASLICLLLSNASAQQLPSFRVDIGGGNAAVWLQTYATTGGPGDFDTATDSDETLAAASVHAFDSAPGYGYAEGNMSAEASVSVPELGVDFNPNVDTSLQTLTDTEAESDPNTDPINYASEYVDVAAAALFEIMENPAHPGVGVNAGSATLEGSIWLLVSGPIESADVRNPITLTATVGGSTLTATTLDQTGQNWVIEGFRTQSTSTNPNEPPEAILAFHQDGFNETFLTTEATNVGAQHTVNGRIMFNDLVVVSDDDPLSSSQLPYGIHQQGMKATAWFEVNVP